jgi:hypothetical protein
MSMRTFGFILLLVLSLALGVGFGEVCFRVFLATVPPVAMSRFIQNSAHGAYLVYGAGMGVVIFVWTLLTILVAPLFKKKKKTAPATS